MIGSVTLRLLGRDRIIQGGPFDDFEPPAIGVCLEVRSRKVAEAALVVPVPDFAAPSVMALKSAVGDVLQLMAASPDLPVYIGCRAGIGRTGMMIAALAKFSGKERPVDWVRAFYHPKAIETVDQMDVIGQLDIGDDPMTHRPVG